MKGQLSQTAGNTSGGNGGGAKLNAGNVKKDEKTEKKRGCCANL